MERVVLVVVSRLFVAVVVFVSRKQGRRGIAKRGYCQNGDVKSLTKTLGVALLGATSLLFHRERTRVRSRKYKRALVMKNTYHRERTSPAWAFVGSEWYVISSLSNIDGVFSISLILMLRFAVVNIGSRGSEKNRYFHE